MDQQQFAWGHYPGYAEVMLGDAGGVAPGEQASVIILPFTSEGYLGAVVFFLGPI